VFSPLLSDYAQEILHVEMAQDESHVGMDVCPSNVSDCAPDKQNLTNH